MEATSERAYTPCGGCGATDPKDRCIGCFHVFFQGDWPEKMAQPTTSPDARPLSDEAVREMWDNATNAVCQEMQARAMCNCPDGDCLAAKVEPSPADLTAALPYMTAAEPVGIKPLEWEHLGGDFYRAPAPLFGSIRIEGSNGADFEVYWSIPGFCDKLIEGSFPTIEAAKAAAQARIRSALVASPAPAVTEAVAWQPVGFLIQGFDGGPFFDTNDEPYRARGHAIVPVFARTSKADAPAFSAQQEPVAWVMPGDDNACPDGFIDAMAWQEGEFTRPLYAEPPASLAPVGEPAAWAFRDNDDDPFRVSISEPEICYEKRPLYASPADDRLREVVEALEACRNAMWADNPADGWKEIIEQADAALVSIREREG